MDRGELRAWLRLLLAPGLGAALSRRLLAALGSPQAIWDADEAALAWLKPRERKAVRAEVPTLDEQVELTWAWLQADTPVGAPRAVITLADERYPAALLQAAADPPVLLFAQGRLDLLQAASLAVVGSRHPTPQGQDNARAFAHALSAAGVTIVSGLADGIDGAAHEGALDGAEAAGLGVSGPGSTIAVVGTGLDRVYPRKHQALAHRIAREGLLISEFPLGTPPLPANFPKRNRIVAGLTRGTLVVEAALQSGSLITARLAGEMGREVLAIPGSIHSPQARGCHALIKQGAKLVETAQDVLEELNWATSVPPAGATVTHLAGDGEEGGDDLLAAMGFDPVSQDALSARTGMGPAELGARLLDLELSGLVARLPGLLFQRLTRA